MMKRAGGIENARKPLLSVDEVAIQLGESRSTIYRSLKRGDLPLPVYTINGRLRIPRRAVERLLEGIDPTREADNRRAVVCPNCEDASHCRQLDARGGVRLAAFQAAD